LVVTDGVGLLAALLVQLGVVDKENTCMLYNYWTVFKLQRHSCI